MRPDTRDLPLRKATLSAILGVAISLLAAPLAGAQPAPKKDGFQTDAPNAILIDADSGTVLFEKNADALFYPASMVKVMTTEVVFHAVREGRIKLDDEFTISENAWRRGGAPSRTSSMFAALHSQVPVEDLLRGAIVQSGNDACIALAEGMAGNELAFAEMMTRRARELGLTNSTFTNSTGLHDPDMKMTARELAKLSQHVVRSYPELYKIYGEPEFLWNKIKQPNRNPLLKMSIGADGLKTGFTKESGYGLVGSATQSGLRLIVVVAGLKTAKDREEESRKLLEWGFRGFESRPLFAAGETVGEAKLYGGEKGRVPLVSQHPIRLLVPRTGSERITARVHYRGPVPVPVRQGQQIGMLKVSRGDSVVLEVPLEAGEDVGGGSLTQRAFDAMSELVINVFRAGVERL